MCGRYVSPEEAAIERLYQIDRRSPSPFARRFNVAPTSQVPMIHRADDGAAELCAARWGLIPHWWKRPEMPSLTFNSRSEDAASKPMWRHSFRHHRCLMPAEGWYEWRVIESADPVGGKSRKSKRPHFVYCPQDATIAFAALASRWTAPTGEVVLSCSILTTAAAPGIAMVHDRMPVVLTAQCFDRWIDRGQTDAQAVAEMISQARTDLGHHAVSTMVNNARNNSPELLREIAES